MNNKIYHDENSEKLKIPEKLKKDIKNFKTFLLSNEQIADVEMLYTGFFPCEQKFMNKEEALSALNDWRLPDGSIWPYPIILPLSEEVANDIENEKYIALTDAEGVILAILKIEEIWEDKAFGDRKYLSGGIIPYDMPVHYDFAGMRLSSDELKITVKKMSSGGSCSVAAVHTSGILFRKELEYIATFFSTKKLVLGIIQGKIPQQKINFFTRVKSSMGAMNYLNSISQRKLTTDSSIPVIYVQPFIDTCQGAQQILCHACIAKNYGANSLFISADLLSDKTRFTESQMGRLGRFLEELNISVTIGLTGNNIIDGSAERISFLSASGIAEEEIVRMIREEDAGIHLWLPDETADLMKKKIKPVYEQGITLFFTGLSGSGKSTVAKAVKSKLHEITEREITLLDGDIVRKNLSSELGFSVEHRNLNIRRIGFVASEITKNGGIAICAPIAPYDAIRKEVRRNIEIYGNFVLIHVNTPLEICEKRDRKGLYAKARKGIIKEFTGISDPYEAPDDADITIDTTDISIEEAVKRVIDYMKQHRFI